MANKKAKKKAKNSPAKKVSAKKFASKKPTLRSASAKKASPKKASPKRASDKKVAAKSGPSSQVSPQASSVVKRSAKAVSGIKLSPVRSRVIIRREEGETKTAGGLYIPDSATEKPQVGRVVAVGTGTLTKKGFNKPMDVQVGDRVVFGKYTGSQINVDGQELLVVEESEIIGVFNK